VSIGQELQKIPTPYNILLVLVIGFFVVLLLNNLYDEMRSTHDAASFSDAEIEHVKQDIRAEFNKRTGVTVEGVQMMTESPRKLIGFAKMKVPLLGEMTKSCTATMSEQGQTMWECR
jgi:hypothetical protein